MKLPAGLRQLDISRPPTGLLPVPNDLVASNIPSQVYQAPKRAEKGITEITRAERHSAHLRKRRMAKVQLKSERKHEKQMAKTDGRVKGRVEKRKAMEVLSRSGQVTIIGKDGQLKGQGRQQLRLGKTKLAKRK